MLYRESNEWKLCPYVVKYIQNGEELEEFTHNKQWWIDFSSKWGNIEILSFIEAQYSLDQLDRLEEIKNMDEGFIEECKNYVNTGIFPEGNRHPLKTLQLEKENLNLKLENETLRMDNLMALDAIAQLYEQVLSLESQVNGTV